MSYPTTYTTKFHHEGYPAIDPRGNAALSMKGKTVLVTGASRGIGRATVKAFAAAGAADVVALARNGRELESLKAEVEAETNATAGGARTRVHVFPTDILSDEALAATFDKVGRAVGTVDVLVANAGYLPEVEPVASSRPGALDDAWRGFEINVRAQVALVRNFLRLASPDHHPVYISVNTAAAHLGYFPGHGAYAASKAAMARVTDFLQAENPQIRFVNVHPGVVDSDMNLKSRLGAPGVTDQLPFDDGFFVWLATPEADFLKGKFVWANWDVDELKAKKDEIAGGNALTFGLLGWLGN